MVSNKKQPRPTDFVSGRAKQSTTAQAWETANQSDYMKTSRQGLDEDLVRQISADKNEPEWMLKHRLKSLELFQTMPLPSWGPNLNNLNLDKITYYAKASDLQATDWKDVPADIKSTFEALGIPEAETKFLSGVGAQYESTVVYHSLKKSIAAQGVIFEDLDVALQKYPDLVKKYFMKCVEPSLHKFAALHGAVWSGGTFLYIPKNVKIDQPLQAYFRMNARGMGQFEHTLMVIEEGAQAHYIEGCSAPRWGIDSLHAGCVEIYVKANARFRYSSVESWSKDAYNLNTKRALVESNAHMEWVGGNFGSQVTMLYPCSILRGEGATADHLGVAFANTGQLQDTGAKVIHAASNTSSKVVMKSISRGGGISVYRGLLEILPNAENCITNVECDALLLDDQSRTDTVPLMKINNQSATVAHEAKAGRLSAEDIFYLTSRGLSNEDAASLIVNGFIDPIVKELPLEYAIEMNRMIELEMEGSVG
ncbi:MAG: Fe-S cluster assembly protein SufB [bacterium]|nr:Fe-S cluster assembly protein SufB [bacterium]